MTVTIGSVIRVSTRPDAGVRTDERIRGMDGLGGRAPSRRTRRIIGLGFVAAILGFYVAAAVGWIGVIPN